MMGAYGHEKHSLPIEKTKDNSITSINTKTPHLLAFWLKFFGVE